MVSWEKISLLCIYASVNPLMNLYYFETQNNTMLQFFNMRLSHSVKKNYFMLITVFHTICTNSHKYSITLQIIIVTSKKPYCI